MRPIHVNSTCLVPPRYIPQGRGVHQSHFQHEQDLDHYHPHHLQHKKLRHLKLGWKARLWLTFEEPEFRYLLVLIVRGSVVVMGWAVVDTRSP